MSLQIERCTAEQAQAVLAQLIVLLQDGIDSGASIGFLPPLAEDEARRYWLKVIEGVQQASRILLVALDDGHLAGSVQLELALMPNGLHRAEVQKLMVHTRFRNRGIGKRLIAAIEDIARDAGRTLLVLDTRRGDVAERMYREIDYTIVGVIPQYARSSEGALMDTVYFYKLL